MSFDLQKASESCRQNQQCDLNGLSTHVSSRLYAGASCVQDASEQLIDFSSQIENSLKLIVILLEQLHQILKLNLLVYRSQIHSMLKISTLGLLNFRAIGRIHEENQIATSSLYVSVPHNIKSSIINADSDPFRRVLS